MPMEVFNGRWNVTAAGTDSGATSTKSGATGKTWVVDSVSCHGDADALLTLQESGTSGNVTLAQWKLDVSIDPNIIVNGYWVICGGEDAILSLSASTSDCQVNLSGFAIP